MSNSSKFNKKISQHNRIILTTICIGVFTASQCYAAESAAVGVDVLKTSMSALKTMLLGDARRVIDVCIVTAGAGGAVMSKNWVPIAVSAMGLVGYELLCASLAQ
jgi:hypothetical protein